MLKEVSKVFTKEYRRETEYQEFLQSFISRIKLSNCSESVTTILDRLREVGYNSNFYVRIGDSNDI